VQYTLFDLASAVSSKWHNFKNMTESGCIYDTIGWDGLVALLPVKKSPTVVPS